MKPISKKQSAINRKRDKAYSEIDHEREPICAGCGKSGIPLSHSHIISQKRAKYLHKPELIYDKNNISLDCYTDSNSCHQRWESGKYDKVEGLMNYGQRLEYLRVNDHQAYMKLVMQIPDKADENSDDDCNEDFDFQCCENCDLPDACADYGCAIKNGVRQNPEY